MSEGLEALKSIRKMFCPSWSLENYEIIEKELKALEIIKNKGLYWGISYQPFEEDNDFRAWDNELYESIKLTKEEYDLLKEVLENE